MPLLVDFVAETATNPGTGTTVNLGGVINGSFRTFLAAFGNGGRCFYTITDEAGARETGIGTVHSGSPNTLTRDTVKSNTAGTLVRLNFTGSVFVFNWLPATQAVYKNELDQTQIGSGTINTNVPGVGNAQLVAGTSTTPGSAEFLDGAGGRTGYVGSLSGGRLILGRGGAGVTGWIVDGDFYVSAGAHIANGLEVLSGGMNFATGNSLSLAGGTLSVNGQIIGTNSRLSFGAFGSGDTQRVCILSDFNNFDDTSYQIWRAPDGHLFQSGPIAPTSSDVTLPFGSAFPSRCTNVIVMPQLNFGGSPIITSVNSYNAANFSCHTVVWNGTAFAGATGSIALRYFATGY